MEDNGEVVWIIVMLVCFATCWWCCCRRSSNEEREERSFTKKHQISLSLHIPERCIWFWFSKQNVGSMSIFETYCDLKHCNMKGRHSAYVLYSTATVVPCSNENFVFKREFQWTKLNRICLYLAIHRMYLKSWNYLIDFTSWDSCNVLECL